MNTAMATATSSPRTPSSPSPAADATRFITPPQLSAHISRIFEFTITVKTLANWRSAKRGPSFVKIGRWVRYDVKEVARWVAARRSSVDGL